MTFNGSLGMALLLGAAFGWTLERAGLGSARKLAGQFYLSDLTGFKVMFSASLTAMLGTFWLGRIGVIDLAAIQVPETFVGPQIVGGLTFGAGFVVSGLCPGTSCVAAASGRGDGVAAALGVFAGVLLAGLAVPLLGPFFSGTARGVWTLPDALHLPYGVVVLGIVAIALAGFRFAATLERRP